MQQLADRLQVLVMHDEPLVAIGLATALRQQPDFAVSVHGIDADPTAADVVIADYEGGVAWAPSFRPACRPRKKAMASSDAAATAIKPSPQGPARERKGLTVLRRRSSASAIRSATSADMI